MGWSEVRSEQPDMNNLRDLYPRDKVKQLFCVKEADTRVKLALILPWVLFVVGMALGYFLLFQPKVTRSALLLSLVSILVLVSFFGGLFGGVYNLYMWHCSKDYYYGITEHENLVCLISSAPNSAAGRTTDEIMNDLNAAIAEGKTLDTFDTRIMKYAHIVRRRFWQVEVRYVDFKDGTFEYAPLFSTSSGYEAIMAILNDRPAPPVL